MSKELKQKAEQKYKEHLADPNYFENSEEESYYTGFIDGYRECEKEHEWHYVKDEGTPTKEGHYLVCLRNKDHDIFDCWIFVSDNIAYSLKVRMKDIIAWKEIVPPELKETE